MNTGTTDDEALYVNPSSIPVNFLNCKEDRPVTRSGSIEIKAGESIYLAPRSARLSDSDDAAKLKAMIDMSEMGKILEDGSVVTREVILSNVPLGCTTSGSSSTFMDTEDEDDIYVQAVGPKMSPSFQNQQFNNFEKRPSTSSAEEINLNQSTVGKMTDKFRIRQLPNKNQQNSKSNQTNPLQRFARASSTASSSGDTSEISGAEAGSSPGIDDSVYLDFVVDSSQLENNHRLAESDDAGTSSMGGKPSKNNNKALTSPVNSSGADSALNSVKNPVEWRKKKGPGKEFLYVNPIARRPLSMPPCDPPDPPPSAHHQTPLPPLGPGRGQRPLPKPPKPGSISSESPSEYCNIEVLSRKSSMPISPPPPVPTSNPQHSASALDDDDYQQPISARQFTPSAQPKTSSTTSPSQSGERRIHPIVRLLKAKQTMAQLQRLPLRLNFMKSFDDDRRSTSTNASPDSDSKLNSNPRRNKRVATSPNLLLSSPSFNKLTQPPKPPPVSPKRKLSGSSTVDLQKTAQKSTGETKNVSPPSKTNMTNVSQRNQLGAKVKPGSEPLVTAVQTHEKAARVKQLTSENATESGASGGDVRNKSVGNLKPPFKKVVDSRGYTLHPLQVERLENQLQKADERRKIESPKCIEHEATEIKPEKSDLSLSKSFEQRSTEKKNKETNASRNAGLKSSPQLKTSALKSPKVKSKPRPVGPPPPRPTTKALKIGEKKPPARPPPPSKEKILESKLRKQMSSGEKILANRMKAIPGTDRKSSVGKLNKESTTSSPSFSSRNPNKREEVYYSAIKDVHPNTKQSDREMKAVAEAIYAGIDDDC